MVFVWPRRLAAAVCITLSITSCGGGTQHATPAVPPLTPANVNGERTTQALTHPSCRQLIELKNPSPHDKTVEIDQLNVNVPCGTNATVFGVTAYQSEPLPDTVQPIKLGDAIFSGPKLVFAFTNSPPPVTVTVTAGTTWTLAILPEANCHPNSEAGCADVAFPVANGKTTVLTSNVPTNFLSTLKFKYDSASGDVVYSAACFTGAPSPAPPHLPGNNPKFFCHIVPGDPTKPITFGSNANPKVIFNAKQFDASVLGLDGPPSNFACMGVAGTTGECDARFFTIGSTSTAITNIVVGDVADLRMCVPVATNADCNRLTPPVPASRCSSAPASTPCLVTAGQELQLLVADDTTYAPGEGLPWSGKFSVPIPPTTSGPCHINVSAENNGDVPAGYTESGLVGGVGPFAEFDVSTGPGAGTCTITFTEDPAFITDFSNPASPTGRSAKLTVTVVAPD
jgi:hypothetical protein